MTLNNFAKKNIKRIIIIFLSCFVFMIGTIFYLFFNALYVQSKIKEKVCATVLKHEDDLLATINECKDNQKKALFYTDVNEDDAICYKELNSKTVNTVFRKFRLAYISCYENNIAKNCIYFNRYYAEWYRVTQRSDTIRIPERERCSY